MLLVPLTVLAVFGSHELSRLQERAETFLRERAFDHLELAASQFDREVASLADRLLTPSLPPDDDVFASARQLREAHPEVHDLFLIEEDGDLVHPLARYPFSFNMRSSTLRDLNAKVAEGKAAEAIPEIEQSIKRNSDRRRGDFVLRYRITLARARAATGDAVAARAEYQSVLDELETEHQVTEEGRRRFFARVRSTDHTNLALLCHTELALLDAADGNRATAAAVARAIGAGDYDAAASSESEAAFERLSAVTDEDLTEARAKLDELLVRHRSIFAYQTLVERPLRLRLSEPGLETPLFHVYDTEDASYLLMLRAVREEEQATYPGAWVGFQIDLPAFAARVLPSVQHPDSDFELGLLSPLGASVLHPNADDRPMSTDALSRPAIAGLQFQVRPRNLAAQLEVRRSAGRNRALLVIALCVAGLGGAIFLVRTVGREAELARTKVDLLSRVSHELRTPLAMIKMYGDTLGMGRTRSEEQARHFAGIISREADRLTTWINRVLDFSTRDSGGIEYHREDTELDDLVNRVIEAYRPHLEAANFTLTSDVTLDLRASVDVGMMENALVNLLENAVKYTPAETDERSIELSLTQQGDHAVVAIADRGVGVPRGEETKIFDAFYRASTAGETRGAGLGLSLVQHFVRAHDGTVSVRPRPGGGSIFELRLPLLTTDDATSS